MLKKHLTNNENKSINIPNTFNFNYICGPSVHFGLIRKKISKSLQGMVLPKHIEIFNCNNEYESPLSYIMSRYHPSYNGSRRLNTMIKPMLWNMKLGTNYKHFTFEIVPYETNNSYNYYAKILV